MGMFEKEVQKYEGFLNDLPTMYFVLDTDGTILFINDFGADYLGYRRDELMGQSVTNVVYQDDLNRFQTHIHRLQDASEVVRWEIRKVKKNGEILLVQEHAWTMEAREGRKAILITCFDITDQKRTEALLESQKRILEMIAADHSLTDILTVLTLMMEERIRDTYSSIMLLDDTGTTLHWGAGPSLPEDYAAAIDGAAIGPAAGSCGTAAYYGKSVIVADIENDPLWMEYKRFALPYGLRSCWSTPIFSSSGGVLGTFAMYSGTIRQPDEISLHVIDSFTHLAGLAIERKKLEEKFRVTTEQLESFINNTADAIVVYDTQGHVIRVNQAYEKIFGWTLQEVVGNKLPNIPAVFQSEAEHFYETVRSGGEVIGVDTIRQRRDGSLFDVNITISPVRDTQGNVVGMSGIARDISQRKQAERKLTESEQHYKSLFEYNPNGICSLDLRGKFLKINPAMEIITGYSGEELLNLSFRSLVFEDEADKAKQYFKQAVQGESQTYETAIQHKDGHRAILSVTNVPIVIHGEIAGIYAIIKDVTGMRQAEETQNRLLAILEVTPDFVATADSQGRALYYNTSARRMLDIGEDADISDISIPETHPEWARDLVLQEGLPSAEQYGVWSGETALLSRDGNEIPVLQVIVAHKNPKEEVEFYSTIAHDIRELKRSEEKQRLAANVIENMTEGLVVMDVAGKIVSVNRAFTVITGYREAEVIGQEFQAFSAEQRESLFYKNIWSTVRENGKWEGEMWNRRKTGESCIIGITITALENERNETVHYVAVFRDITESKSASETIQYMAYYDTMTGLPNRSLLKNRFESAQKSFTGNRDRMAVMFIDLDRFKHINDTLGHSAGDTLLKNVAERLRECGGIHDTIGRFGGDEFVALFPNLSNPRAAADIAERINHRLSQPFVLDGQEFFLTTSIGISLYPDDGTTLDTLIKHADLAMYNAKDKGSHYQFYSAEMNSTTNHRLVMERELHKALDRSELLLYYQPKMDLRNEKILGIEALLRWRHPEMGMVSPGDFIPIAEENGLIFPIGKWVLCTACTQNKTWQQAGYPPVRVSVNLSARQFQQPDLIEMIDDVLHETGLDPEWLEIEITESALMKDVEATISKLRQLRQRGILISIDDFGQGYSSLSYLKRFPLDILKIDRSFVSELTEDLVNEAIVKAIITLGHNLNLSVIAEGVENEQQVVFLRQQRCDGIQGYVFSRPLPAIEVTKLLHHKSDF